MMFEKKTEGSSKYRCINAYYLISSGKISPDVQYKEIVDIKPWTKSIEPLMLLLTTINNFICNYIFSSDV